MSVGCGVGGWGLGVKGLGVGVYRMASAVPIPAARGSPAQGEAGYECSVGYEYSGNETQVRS